MSLISLRNIRVAFDGPLVLEDLSIDIHKGQRICILGRNGSGKSTLMRIINGDLKPDAGEIIISPGLKVSYLTQDVPDNPELCNRFVNRGERDGGSFDAKTADNGNSISKGFADKNVPYLATNSKSYCKIRDSITGSAFDIVAQGAGKIGESLAEYHRQLANPTDDDLFHKLQHDLTEHNGWQIEAVINRVLDQVQVNPDVEFASLSGGIRRRVFLARALVNEPDILLLDEPTNHLDLESIKWLENFLLTARLTVLFVTHDRRLLKKLATRIVEIDRGKIIDWSCDYLTFLVRKEAVLENEERANSEFDKKLAQEEIWIRKGVKARSTRAEGRVNALKKMREERKKRRERTGNVAMTISEGERSGNKVLEAKNISFAYNDKLIINNFSFYLTRGDRIGIIGPNGCGKTTLLNLLLDRIKPQTGTVDLGANVTPLYFDQLRKGIDTEKTVWENVATGGGDTVIVNGNSRHIISYLQDFLFTSERARTRVKWLSGGERHRLLLARLFTIPSNLLVFDEPTNDLDTETLELLEEVLLQYEGTLIVVSHDREFLNNVVTSALIFRKDYKIDEYVGGYDDWERQIENSTEPPKPLPLVKKKKLASKPIIKVPRNISVKEKRELETIASIIETLESEQRNIHTQLADFTQCQKPGFTTQSKARLAEIEAELSKTFSRWEELETLNKN